MHAICALAGGLGSPVAMAPAATSPVLPGAPRARTSETLASRV